MISPVVVGIAGGSGSGKTRLADALARSLGRARVARLPHDAYYVDRAHLPAEARAAVNYDVPEAFDRGRFLGDLRALRAGAAVRPPRYCFATHRRLGDGELVEPRPVILVDGILLLHDPDVRAALDLGIYVDAPEDVRLARRLARDTRERGRTAGAVVAQFDATVRPAHAAYVEPTKALADLVLLNVGGLEAAAARAAAAIEAHLARRSGARAAEVV